MIAVLLGGYSFITFSRINVLNDELATVTEMDDLVQTFVAAHHVWGFNFQRAFLLDQAFPGGLDPYACGYGVWKQGEGPHLLGDAEILRLVAAIYQPHYDLHVRGGEALRLREEGRYAEAMHLVETVVLPAVTESTTRITDLSNRVRELRDEKANEINVYGETAHTIIIMALVLAVIAFVGLSFFITRSIMAPIKGLVSLVSEVTHGRLAINKNTSGLADDEIGRLTRDIYNLADVIKSIMDDLSTATHEYLKIGDMHYTIDESRYENSFKEVIERVNELLAQTTTDIYSITEIVNF
jgi:methyl-accepting chemotaxis protein